MIFGNPYRFAIWVEVVPEWSDSFKNGLFYFVINGDAYPGDIRVATLSVDLYEIIDDECALISHPRNDDIFSLPTKEAFDKLYKLAYPESSNDDEYPSQIFDYCITSSNISSFGGRFFAVADESNLRIIGGTVERLVRGSDEDGGYWEGIDNPKIEDITLSRGEMKKIISDVKEYVSSVL